MDAYDGQNLVLNQKISVYIFNGKNCTLTIQAAISNITINGSKNKIIFKAKSPNVIVNGSKNEINCEHAKSALCNLIFNGSYNKITCNRKSFNCNKIDNGVGNSMTCAEVSGMGSNASYSSSSVGNNQTFNNFTNFSTSNSNYTIRINNNFGNIDTGNLFDVINSITGNLNMNFQMNGSQSHVNRNINIEEEVSYEDEEEALEHDEDNPEQTEEEMSEEAYREYLLSKREGLIEELNEFQFKNVNKFMNRKDDTCSICLEKYKPNDAVKQFSCNEHIFHKKCLAEWLKTSNYCPLCKHDLMDDIVMEDDNQS